MENKKDSKKSSSNNNLRKPIRMRSRRSHTRRVPQDCAINIAEARREIVNALHLHRSSSSTTTTTTTTASPYGGKSVFAISCSNHDQVQYYYNCYSMMEAMPVPEPTWSTTAPSILAPPPPFEEPKLKDDEFELLGDDQNQASSYTWWLSFLKTLDDSTTHEKYSSCCYKPFEGNLVMGNSTRVYGQYCNSNMDAGSLHKDQSPSLDACHEYDYSPYPDEWLTIPKTENQGEMLNPNEHGMGFY